MRAKIQVFLGLFLLAWLFLLLNPVCNFLPSAKQRNQSTQPSAQPPPETTTPPETEDKPTFPNVEVIIIRAHR